MMMRTFLLLLALLSGVALPAQAQYDYDSIANAKEKPLVWQTISGVLAESQKNYSILISETNQSYEAYDSAQKKANAKNPPPSPNSYCGASDTCFQVVSSEKGKVTIKCTKGSQYKIGQTQNICGPDSKGKYAAGCGVTNAFAYHYTLTKAGNMACEY